MFTVRSDGHLMPADLVVDAHADLPPGGPACLSGPTSITAPLDAEISADQHVLVLRYSSPGGAVLNVSAESDGRPITDVWDPYVVSGEGTLVARLGPHATRSLTIVVAGGSACIDQVRVGHDVEVRQSGRGGAGGAPV